MWFINFSIQNPVKVAVAVILSVMFGMIAYYKTPVQLTPDVIEPQITVTTMWPGASAQEVEREIVEEQEAQLKSVEGMREFTSTSAPGVATIVMKFEVEVDLDVAFANVSDKLNQVPQYPEDAREPTISRVDPNANAIAWFILKPIPPTADDLRAFAETHPEAAEDLAPMTSGAQKIALSKLQRLGTKHPDLLAYVEGKNNAANMRKFAQDNIESVFERVEGIANANVVGGREQEFRIVVDPARLAAFKVTVGDLRRQLDLRNKNTSAGDLWEGKSRSEIRTIGQFDSPQQVAETIIAVRDGSPVRVKDVARVELDYKKPDGVVRQKGVAGLAINAQQAPGTNLIDIMGPPRSAFDADGDGEITPLELSEAKMKYGNSLRYAAEEINQSVLKQRGLYLEQVYDQTEYLDSARSLVVNNIYVGGALAIMVLLLFLRSARSVLIIGLSIPISIIATFLFVQGFGRSINVISLAGMAFAVGMVVDNAIVVLENIYRHYQMGDEPEVAAAKGTNEVWGAVLASTLTTLAVFIPVIFVQGQAGQLFRDIAIAISCAVGLSLITSITVIPTAAKRILKKRTSERDDGERSIPAGFDEESKTGSLNRLTRAWGNFIYWLITLRGGTVLRLLIVFLFVSGSLLGAYWLTPQKEYLPEGNRNLVIGIMIPPPGYNLEKMMDIGNSVEAELAKYWETEEGTPEAKELGVLIDNFFFVARGRMLFMGARSIDPLQAARLIPIMQRAASQTPAVFVRVSQTSLFDSALSGGRYIDLQITGPDLEELYKEASALFLYNPERPSDFPEPVLKHFPPNEGHQAVPVAGLDITSPELHVLPQWEKASEVGLSAADLGYAVNALVDGAYAGDYWHEGDKIDLVIYGSESYIQHSQDIERLPIATPSGNLVPVSAVANVVMNRGPDQVGHIERQRAVTIQIKPAPNMPLETAMAIVNTKIRRAAMERPNFSSGLYQLRLAGTADKLAETAADLQWNLLLAFVITYLLMSALFESFLYPVVIMISVMLALVGGFFGLWLLNLFIPQALDMLTMLGFVILIGTVVNNAILIVHQSLNYMREDQMDPRIAIRESVRTRIRPILMSTLTTVLGMLPLVVPLPSWGDSGIEFVAGAGSELYRGLGSVVLGGLIVSTAFTLLLIPVGFSLAIDLKAFVARMTLGRLPAELDVATPEQKPAI